MTISAEFYYISSGEIENGGNGGNMATRAIVKELEANELTK